MSPVRSDDMSRTDMSSEAAALVMRAEEVLAAGGRHRRARGDLERERRGGDDLREAVDLAAAGAADRLEPVARGRERRPAADGSHLEAREPERGVQAAVHAPAGGPPLAGRRGAAAAMALFWRGRAGGVCVRPRRPPPAPRPRGGGPGGRGGAFPPPPRPPRPGGALPPPAALQSRIAGSSDS